MCVHIGMHIDAPSHFLSGGASISDLELVRFVGEAQVVDLSRAHEIGAEELDSIEVKSGTKRLLLKTSNSRLYKRNVFDKDCVALMPDGTEWVRAKDISVVGSDYASIDTFGERENETHKIFLNAGIAIVEGLDFSKISPGIYAFICLPLKLTGVEVHRQEQY